MCPDFFEFDWRWCAILNSTANMCYFSLGAYFISVMLRATRTIYDLIEVEKEDDRTEATRSTGVNTSPVGLSRSDIQNAGLRKKRLSRCMLRV